MEQRKQKRYYKVDETVYVKEEGVLGVIKELNVKPEEQVYEAIVEIVEGDQKYSKLKVNLWEIDKNKRPSAKDKQETAILTVPKKPTILFAKVKSEAIIPSKEDENAGYDIYACFDGEGFTLAPHETRLVPTGIASSVTDDWVLVGKERASTGVKGMAIRAGIIDSGYRGEIFIAITNENTKPLVITKKPELFGDQFVVYPASKAIAQLLLIPVPKANIKEIPYEQLKAIPSKRGTGKVGSSGK